MLRMKLILLPIMISTLAGCATGPRLVIKESIEELQQVARNDPNDYIAHYNLGLGYTVEKDYDRALEAFSRTLKINPHFADACFAIFCIEYARDSKLYAEWLKERPSEETKQKLREVDKYLQSAFMYDPFFDWKVLTILLETKPTSSNPCTQAFIDAVYSLVADGFRQFALGNYEKSIRSLKFLIETHPEFIQARLVRGLAHAQLRNYDAARSDFQFIIDKQDEFSTKKILPIHMETSELYYVIGYSYLQQGKLDEAEHSFKQVIVEQSNFYMAYFHLAGIYNQRKEYEPALRELDASLIIEPNDAVIHFNKGALLARSGEAQQALEEYTTAISINPNYSKAYYNLALVFEALGRNEEALANYDNFIRTAPSRFGDFIHKAQEKIKALEQN